MELLSILLLFAVGILAGAVNAIAGGATMFTFPTLMAVGLPPIVASASNFVAVMPGNFAPLLAYRTELKAIGRKAFPLVLISLFGAGVGSVLLSISDPDFFAFLVPILILLATIFFQFGARLGQCLTKYISGKQKQGISLIILFTFSIYGGYFGAGIGIMLLATFQIMGYAEFHQANALKNLVAASFSVLSVIILGFNNLIAWPEALVMMLGATIGGYLGGLFGLRINDRFIRYAITAFGLVLSGIYFFRNFG